MILTEQQIKVIMPSAGSKAREYLPYINKYAEEFGINTPLRMCHYLAQIAHESNCLLHAEENLYYRADRIVKVFPKYFNHTTAQQYACQPTKLANKVYANRMGNGNEASGDGYRYRGRGLIQITGKDNYRRYGEYLRSHGITVDMFSHPELLSEPVGAVKSSMWYFKTHGCNQLADKDDILSITKKVNGGIEGLDKRRVFLYRAKLMVK